MDLEQRAGTLDEFIAHLADTYPQLPLEAWQDFKDQVVALGEEHGGIVTLRFDYDVETNTITVGVAQPN
jgi:hypothetical protein